MSESINVDVPTVGESISEVQIGQWLKQEGDWVKDGEDLVEIETEKASVQIPAPGSGFLENIQKASEEFALVGETIASIRLSDAPASNGPPAAASSPSASAGSSPASSGNQGSESQSSQTAIASGTSAAFVMPAAKRLLEEHGLSQNQVPATGPGGRLLKEDVLAFVRNRGNAPAPATASKPAASVPSPAPRPTASTSLVADSAPNRSEEVKPLSMLRRTIAVGQRGNS